MLSVLAPIWLINTFGRPFQLSSTSGYRDRLSSVIVELSHVCRSANDELPSTPFTSPAPVTDELERWVSVEAVADHLGVARDSIYRWIEGRGLPGHRIGRLLKFKLSEVDAWVRGDGQTSEGLSGRGKS
jgi:excisionase family DNA binding protein